MLNWLSDRAFEYIKMREQNNRGEGEPGPSPLNVDPARLPKHVAVIMDGNGRWAAKQQRPAMFGHDRGVQALRKVVECCGAWKIPYLTVYAFSTENWQRNADEVSFLFGLMERVLTSDLGEMASTGVRLRFLGERARLPPSLQEAMERAEEATADNDVLNFNIAVSYSGRQDLTQAVRSIAERVAAGQLSPEEVTSDMISDHLTTAQLPAGCRAPDLVIRTSGERRLSNFLLWESAYSELYFTPVYWPDFGEAELRAALEDYASRDRRYGKRTEPSAATARVANGRQAASAGAAPQAAELGMGPVNAADSEQHPRGGFEGPAGDTLPARAARMKLATAAATEATVIDAKVDAATTTAPRQLQQEQGDGIGAGSRLPSRPNDVAVSVEVVEDSSCASNGDESSSNRACNTSSLSNGLLKIVPVAEGWAGGLSAANGLISTNGSGPLMH